MKAYVPTRAGGIFNALLSSSTFGLIPLFTLPLMAAGIPVATTLAYRFSIAAGVMWLIIRLCGISLDIGRAAFCKLAVLSIFYMMAVLLYFYALAFLPSGVVATLQFLYPVMVMLIMVGFFHERFSWRTAIAVALAFGGVALLSLGESLNPDESARNMLLGMLLSLMAGLGNGLYMVGLQVAKLPGIDGLVMTFYVMLFGTIFCLANALVTDSLIWLATPYELGLATLLALITGVFSNLTLVFAIRGIGSTLTSILGVLEPLTAVAVGTFVFAEPFTPQLATGVLLIVLAVWLALKAGSSGGQTQA